MENAATDENGVSTLLGVLESDGATTIRINADPTSHALGVDDNTTGSDLGPANAPRDQNFVPALLAVSSEDGETPVVVYATADGLLLIDSSSGGVAPV